MNDNCIECGKRLVGDEKSLYRRLVKRTAEEFLCIPCMAKHFRVDEKVLYERIKMYRSMGCCLFGQEDNSADENRS